MALYVIALCSSVLWFLFLLSFASRQSSSDRNLARILGAFTAFVALVGWTVYAGGAWRHWKGYDRAFIYPIGRFSLRGSFAGAVVADVVWIMAALMCAAL
eukprot:832045_1